VRQIFNLGGLLAAYISSKWVALSAIIGGGMEAINTTEFNHQREIQNWNI
jgi:hypothetical protein